MSYIKHNYQLLCSCTGTKAISAEVMPAVYKLHKSQTVLFYQFYWYFIVI